MCQLASGKTVTGISDELSLSVKTVSTYRKRILTKMHMKNNAEIINYVIKHGLLE
jgi:DNA-binding NarL/FixJ family response regulator